LAAIPASEVRFRLSTTEDVFAGFTLASAFVLINVISGVWVISRAMRFLRLTILVPLSLDCIHHVVMVCALIQMGWIHTKRVVASMADNLVVLKRAIPGFKSEAVSFDDFSIPEAAIHSSWTPRCRGNPLPALALDLKLCEECFEVGQILRQCQRLKLVGVHSAS
jgi:hypothetical protein